VARPENFSCAREIVPLRVAGRLSVEVIEHRSLQVLPRIRLLHVATILLDPSTTQLAIVLPAEALLR
jgi:hypothetical protein